MKPCRMEGTCRHRGSPPASAESQKLSCTFFSLQVGDTGAGKSSLLNALLGEEEVLPQK